MEKEGKFIALLATIMRVSIINLSIIILTALYSYGAYEVTAQELLAKSVSVEFIDTDIKTALAELESKANVKFVYTSRSVPLKRRITLQVTNQSMAETLDALFSPDKVTYKIIRNRILLSVEEQIKGSFLVIPITDSEPIWIDRMIRGKVTDENGEGLPGVNVVIKGTQRGTVSTADGNYELQVPDDNGILVFSFVGFITQEFTIGANSSIDVILKEDRKSLDEVVVVGYGTQKRSSVTAAISSVPMNEIQDMPVSNVATAMQGKIPGVIIQQSNGVPGNSPAIKVRGFGSITAGNAPLIVVDGNIVSADFFAQINSQDIESIDVLKDASSSAIYGSRGANGVVMVTTKKGKSGTSVVNLDVFAGVQNVSKKMDILNSQQFAELGIDAANNAYLDHVPGAKISDPNNVRPSSFLRYRYPRGEVLDWFDFDDPVKVANLPYHDYQDLIFRPAKMSSYQLSLSGGTEKTRYSLSGGYLNQDGVVRGSDLERYTVRTNIETQVLPKLKIGLSAIPSFRIRNEVTTDGHWASNGVINSALSTMPMSPIYAADGITYSSQTELAPAYNYPGVTNPVANITELDRELKTISLLANAFAEYRILESLMYRITGNVNFNGNRRNSFRTSRMPLNQILPPTVATGEAYSDQGLSWLFNQILDYNKTLNNNHEIGVLVGMESTKYGFESSSATGNAFPNDLVRTLNASTSGATTTATSSMVENSTVSYFARVSYSYLSKYLINISVRRDGSSIFGPDRRWGSFPAFSFGWRLSEEIFLRDIQGLSELKLRASYGLSGNNAFSNYYPHAALLTTDNYVFNNVLANGLRPSSPENRNLSWEKNEQFDIGLDIGLFNNRLYLTTDYYNRLTKDLLLSVNVPTITGFSTVVQNIGKMKNSGWEFSANSRNLTGPLVWNTSANISFNRNRVLALGPTGDPIRSGSGVGETNITMIGEPIGSFFGYRQLGVFRNQAELDAYPHDATSKPGDVKYADVNGDGRINADDRELIGNNQPNFIYGLTNNLTFKGFDINLTIQGTQGGQILNLSRRFFDNLEGNQNQLTTVLDRWRSESDPGNGITPRANARTSGLNNAVSSRWVEDASYLRIQNLSIGYRFSPSLTEKLKIQQLRVYLSAQNLHTWTKYLGYNPEVSNYESALTGGVDYGSFPLARTISVGINIGL